MAFVLLCSIAVLVLVNVSTATAQTNAVVSPYGTMFTFAPTTTSRGTVEFELGAVYTDEASVNAPLTIKHTPAWDVGPLRTLEFGLSWDVVQSSDADGVRTTSVGNAVTITTRRPLIQKGRLAAAVGPWLIASRTTGLATGIRGMASWSQGPATLYLNANVASGSASTKESRFEVQLDYYRAVRRSGRLSAMYWSVGGMYQQWRRAGSEFAVAEGISYQFTPQMQLDCSIHHETLRAGVSHQLVLALTVNAGRPWRR